MTSASSLGSSGSGTSYITSTPSLTVTVTPPPTSGSSTDFVYVDYDHYDEYSSYEDLSIPSTDVIPTSGTTTTSTTTTQPVKTASTDSLKRISAVPTEPTTSQHSTPTPVRMSAATVSADPDDIITATLSPNKTSAGRSLQMNLTTSPSFFPLSKSENNSVDEVSYRIVGLDGDITRGQQNYFVPRMPPVRERTQNKRIQQLLNEKRRQDLLRRSVRSREGRTDRRHDGF